MALLSDILSRRYKGASWSLDGDDYATLDWEAVNIIPKPTEAELRALSASVDAEMADDAIRNRQNDAIQDRPDALLTALEVLAGAVGDMQGKLRASALTSPLATQATTAITTLRNKLTQARSV